MSVNVAIGNAVIETVRSGVTFKVFIFNTAVENLAIGNNAGGTNRVDAIVLKLSRTTEPNALMNNVAELVVVEGSGATALSDGAIDTALGSDYDWIRLADVTVEPAETIIQNADIADTRVRVKTTDAVQYSPTVLSFKVLTADPTTKVEGDLWYNSTDNVMRYYDGSATINVEASVFTGGDGIDITSGIISVELAPDSGLDFDSGKLKNVGVQENVTAGETIADRRPVFIDDTANKWKYCDANDTARLVFDGFSLEAKVLDETMKVQVSGIVNGFTGLDAGKKYYIQDDGTIGTSVGTYEVFVGVAISATELLIIKGSDEYIGTEAVSASSAGDCSDTATMPVNARTAIIVIEYDSWTSNSNFGRSKAQATIKRRGATSVLLWDGMDTSNVTNKISISLSVNTITFTVTAGNGSSLSGNVYYYN